jgi:RNA recognition motif-containing protein
LFVGNLEKEITMEELKEMFSKYGEILVCWFYIFLWFFHSFSFLCCVLFCLVWCSFCLFCPMFRCLWIVHSWLPLGFLYRLFITLHFPKAILAWCFTMLSLSSTMLPSQQKYLCPCSIWWNYDII